MLRAIILAALLAWPGAPAMAFSWSVYSDKTIRGYAKASASRSCLTGDTRAVLNRLEGRIGKVRVVSTCRPGARIRGTNRQSKHAIGRAVDFNTPRKAQAIAFLRSQGVFVMTYCGMSHVHFNTGQSGASFCGKGYVSARKRLRR